MPAETTEPIELVDTSLEPEFYGERLWLGLIFLEWPQGGATVATHWPFC